MSSSPPAPAGFSDGPAPTPGFSYGFADGLTDGADDPGNDSALIIAEVIIGIGLGIIVVGIIVGIIYRIRKAMLKKIKPKTGQDDHGTNDDVVLGRTLTHIVPQKARNRKPRITKVDHTQDQLGAQEDIRLQNPTVETMDDEETKLERETVEVFIDHMIKEKPIRFSSKELAVLTSNYRTKLGSGGFGEVYHGKFTNGVKLAVKVLKTSNIDKRVLDTEV